MNKTSPEILARCKAYRERQLADPETAERYRARQKASRDRRNADPAVAEKQREYRREYRAKNKDKLDARNVRRQREFSAEIQLQRKKLPLELSDIVRSAVKCQICDGEPDGRWRSLAIDHCHETGTFRGMLCSNCNRGLGMFKDNPDLLRSAAIYLEDHRETLSDQYRKTLEGECL